MLLIICVLFSVFNVKRSKQIQSSKYAMYDEGDMIVVTNKQCPKDGYSELLVDGLDRNS